MPDLKKSNKLYTDVLSISWNHDFGFAGASAIIFGFCGGQVSVLGSACRQPHAAFSFSRRCWFYYAFAATTVVEQLYCKKKAGGCKFGLMDASAEPPTPPVAPKPDSPQAKTDSQTMSAGMGITPEDHEKHAAVDAPSAFAIHAYPSVKSCVVSSNIKDVMNEVLEGTEKALENDLKRTTLADVVARVRSR